MGEIDLRFAARGVDLLEEDLAIGAVKSAPVPDRTLQGAALALTELARISERSAPVMTSGASILSSAMAGVSLRA